jgi:hypothetical protein
MAPSPGIFASKSPEFHLSEYACLRKEVELMLEDYHALERNVVIAVGITWGWLYDKCALPWMFCIPCLFAILGAIRAKGISGAFGKLRGYLIEIEIAFWSTDGPEGWEHFHKDTGFSKGAVPFWSILILATLVVAVLRICHLL